jgi:hypothetical protein
MAANAVLSLPQAPPADPLQDGRSFVLSLRHGRLSVEDRGGEAVLSGDLASAKRLYRDVRLTRGTGEPS